MTTQKYYATKEIFDTVYNWGRWGIQVDNTAPAFLKDISRLQSIIINEMDKPKITIVNPKLVSKLKARKKRRAIKRYRAQVGIMIVSAVVSGIIFSLILTR